MLARLAAIAALAALPFTATATPVCYPDGNGGQLCTGGVDAACIPPLVPVWVNATQFRCVSPAFMCEARVVFDRAAPANVKVVPDASCSSDALRSALAVAAAKLSLGQPDVFYP